MTLSWKKPDELPTTAEQIGGHKVRPCYFIVLQNQIVPDVFVWIAEERVFTTKGIDVRADTIQAAALFGDLPFPSWLERRTS